MDEDYILQDATEKYKKDVNGSVLPSGFGAFSALVYLENGGKNETLKASIRNRKAYRP